MRGGEEMDQADAQDRLITEEMYLAWLGWRLPELASEITEMLPQEARDAGLRFDWMPGTEPAVQTGIGNEGGLLDEGSPFRADTWENVNWAPWTPFRNRLPSVTRCYRLASGARVHIQPDCRCRR